MNIHQFFIIAALFFLLGSPHANSAFSPETDDRQLSEPVSLPEWFRVSFLDIKEEIEEANNNKKGLILYFGQEYCPYCKAHLENNWNRKDIVKYTRKHFEVVAINIRGDRQVTDIDGQQYTEKTFASKYRATFTPTLIFFDKSGTPALKLTGYRKPYQFLAALEYVADNHHKKENFRHYLSRAEGAESFGQEDLNESVIFLPPPYKLNKLPGKKPLAVFFEEKKCHACDILHAEPLNNHELLKKFSKIYSVQLDMWSDTPVTTPSGKKTTAKSWADQMALNYAPTIIFYDENGKEIIRVESVVGFFRLKGVLEYVTSGAYRNHPAFEIWNLERNRRPVDN